MARPSSLRVMLSSRANSRVFAEQVLLTDCRQRLKAHLETEELFQAQLFDVWIHEDAEAADATDDAWEESLEQVRRADVVIVLYNGEAGWGVTAADVGICHAEMNAALDSEPGKVYLVKIEPLAELPAAGATRLRDQRFRSYVDGLQRFHGRIATTYESLESQVALTLREAVVDLAHLGVRESRRGRWASGEALDWSRLDFARRKAAMERVAAAALVERGGEEREDGVSVQVAGQRALFCCHAVPAAMSVAAAREMVGQPFLGDHRLADQLAEDGGPIHLVLCHRGATENQASRLLGFPDATLVTAPFGIWAADEAQKIQLVLVANCRDPTATRHGIQRLFEWLEQSGEGALLARRAASRARIVRTIAEELR